MDPREFLRVASELVAVTGATPARVRTSVSRAYYAAYNTGVELLTEMGLTIDKSPKGHAAVYMRLHNSGDVEVEKAGSQLSDLLGKRIKADYRLDDRDVEYQKTAQADIEVARRIIQILDACRNGSRRTLIIKAIRDWERKTGEI